MYGKMLNIQRQKLINTHKVLKNNHFILILIFTKINL